MGESGFGRSKFSLSVSRKCTVGVLLAVAAAMRQTEILWTIVGVIVVLVFYDKIRMPMSLADSLVAKVADLPVSLSEEKPHPGITGAPRPGQVGNNTLISV